MWYKPTQTEWCEPVNKRAAEIPDEYIKKLREKDRRYHNTANGEVGPMEEALMSYNSCSGLVRGFYGEFSKDIDQLIKLTAEVGAELHAAKYGLDLEQQANQLRACEQNPHELGDGTCMWQCRCHTVKLALRAWQHRG